MAIRIVLALLAAFLTAGPTTTAGAQGTKNPAFSMLSQAATHERLIIFVHGFRGDPRTTFKADKSSLSWPELMQLDHASADGAPPLSAYSMGVLQYPTDEHRPDEVVSLLTDALKRAKEVQSHKRIYFVGHSFGGLVVALLLNAAVTGGSPFPELARKTEAVFFIATPFGGIPTRSVLSPITKYMSPGLAFSLNDVENNYLLRDMRTRWAQFRAEREKNKRPLVQVCAYELQPVSYMVIFRQIIVAETSVATNCLGSETRAVNADHITIVKPEDREAEIYIWLRQWLARIDAPRSTPPDDHREDSARPKIAAAPPHVEPPGPSIEKPPQPAAAQPPITAPAPFEHKPLARIRKAPVPEDKQGDGEHLLAQKLIDGRQVEHDRQMRERDEKARKLDADVDPSMSYQSRLEHDARTAAGIGYRLRENTSVAKSSFHRVRTDTVANCALECIKHGCDAFSWYRDQYPVNSPNKRYCFLFKRPFEIANNPGYVLGEPTPDPSIKSGIAPRRGLDAPIHLAQAGPPKNVPPQGDDLTRCAGGPVKVTGFKLACDRTLGGGTTLGSHRLSYTVTNINECAAKCRPIERCVGFTFNSGDPPGQHACIIFGPTPEGRESKGWIAGVR